MAMQASVEATTCAPSETTTAPTAFLKVLRVFALRTQV
jgi:hypothetical protein